MKNPVIGHLAACQGIIGTLEKFCSVNLRKYSCRAFPSGRCDLQSIVLSGFSPNHCIYMKIPTRFILVLASCGLLLSCSKVTMVEGSASMEPTIKAGGEIEVDTAAYAKTSPARWDAIIYHSPQGGGQLCSRVVGLPGEIINFTKDGLTINGKVITPPPHFQKPDYKMPAKGSEVTTIAMPYTVPENRYFVIGDNVYNSVDSRYWGALDAARIVGKVHDK